MLIIAFFLFVLAVVLFWQAHRRQKTLGMPAGRIISSDTRQWEPLADPLYSAELGLTGRPDYLIKNGSQVIPVEIKSSRISAVPYDSHIYQLAAYCLLVEKAFGVRPAYGVLHYPNRTFAIDYTSELETTLLQLLSELRLQENRRDVHRSHDQASRCTGCGYAGLCDEKILS